MTDHTLSNSLIVTSLALIVAFAAFAGPSTEPRRVNPVVGEKLDSGLGELPRWNAAPDRINPVAGEKLDSGLGDLAQWRPEAPVAAKAAAQ
jgi:hypothetical protein